MALYKPFFWSRVIWIAYEKNSTPLHATEFAKGRGHRAVVAIQSEGESGKTIRRKGDREG